MLEVALNGDETAMRDMLEEALVVECVNRRKGVRHSCHARQRNSGMQASTMLHHAVPNGTRLMPYPSVDSYFQLSSGFLWVPVALQLIFAYREVDENGVPLRRGFREVATHLGMTEERCGRPPARSLSTCLGSSLTTSAFGCHAPCPRQPAMCV